MTRHAFAQNGERQQLLPKALTYVFSLDFALDMGSLRDRPPAALVLKDRTEPRIFHVTDEQFVTLADGSIRDVPVAHLTSAYDVLPLTRDPVVLNGRLVFKTDTPAPLAMSYGGVLDAPGGTWLWCRSTRPATVFVHCQQDYVGAKYRWLVQNQLIGVGVARANERDATLEFDLDFYIAS